MDDPLQHLRLRPLVVAQTTPHPAAGVGAAEDEVAHALRVARRVGDRRSTALGDPEQREPLDPRRLHDGLQVGDELAEPQPRRLAIGESSST